MRLLFCIICSLSLSTSLHADEEAQPRVTQTLSLLKKNDLGQWKAAPFAFDGDVDVYDGVLSIGLGDYLSGVIWKTAPPAKMNYEIELEARYKFGNDFFVGLTVPVRNSYCTWINGGWGGTIVGLSDINEKSADNNETTKEMTFERDRWYRFKIRVYEDRIQCWIDRKRIVNVDIKDKRLRLRPGVIEKSIPLGISTYDTEGEYRKLVWRNLAKP